MVLFVEGIEQKWVQFLPFLVYSLTNNLKIQGYGKVTDLTAYMLPPLDFQKLT